MVSSNAPKPLIFTWLKSAKITSLSSWLIINNSAPGMSVLKIYIWNCWTEHNILGDEEGKDTHWSRFLNMQWKKQAKRCGVKPYLVTKTSNELSLSFNSILLNPIEPQPVFLQVELGFGSYCCFVCSKLVSYYL